MITFRGKYYFNKARQKLFVSKKIGKKKDEYEDVFIVLRAAYIGNVNAKHE